MRAVCRGPTAPEEVQVGKKAEEFFENVKDFIAAKHEIDATAERVLPDRTWTRISHLNLPFCRHGGHVDR